MALITCVFRNPMWLGKASVTYKRDFFINLITLHATQLRALYTIIMVAFSTEYCTSLQWNERKWILHWKEMCDFSKVAYALNFSVWPMFLLCVVLEAIKFKWSSLPCIQICTGISVKWQDPFHLPGTDLELISPISKPHLQLCQCSGLSLSCKSVGFICSYLLYSGRSVCGESIQVW